jgi:hypothetical protein
LAWVGIPPAVEGSWAAPVPGTRPGVPLAWAGSPLAVGGSWAAAVPGTRLAARLAWAGIPLAAGGSEAAPVPGTRLAVRLAWAGIPPAVGDSGAAPVAGTRQADPVAAETQVRRAAPNWYGSGRHPPGAPQGRARSGPGHDASGVRGHSIPIGRRTTPMARPCRHRDRSADHRCSCSPDRCRGRIGKARARNRLLGSPEGNIQPGHSHSPGPPAERSNRSMARAESPSRVRDASAHSITI